MERERYLPEARRLLVLIPNNEVAFVMENQEIRKLVEKYVEVLEFGAPRLREIDQGQRPWLFDKYVHILCSGIYYYIR